MKRKSNKDRRTTPHTLRLWTFSEAQAAAPYILSVVSSMREHGLEVQALRRRLKQLQDRPGRANRSALIEQQEALESLHRVEEQFAAAEEELLGLDIYSLNPLQGQALVPFVLDGDLAWYIFDLFDSAPFRFWRFQSDPEETRRHLTAAQKH